MIGIVDYRAGNIASIRNMLKKLGLKSKIISNSEELLSAEKIILPGVGHFAHGIDQLNKMNFVEALKMKAEQNTPILGICLGAQLLGNSSEEGGTSGLGLVDMEVVKFDRTRMAERTKVPHMGWSELIDVKTDSEIFKDMDEQARFYFVHAYHFAMKNSADVIANTHHGYSFAAAFQSANVYGVQFHPEKSHKYGMQLLTNFSRIDAKS